MKPTHAAATIAGTLALCVILNPGWDSEPEPRQRVAVANTQAAASATYTIPAGYYSDEMQGASERWVANGSPGKAPEKKRGKKQEPPAVAVTVAEDGTLVPREFYHPNNVSEVYAAAACAGETRAPYPSEEYC